MSEFVTFPESEVYSPRPPSYINIYDRVKDAASTVVSSLIPSSSTALSTPAESASAQLQSFSIANQNASEAPGENKADTNGANSPAKPPPLNRNDTAISIAAIGSSEQSSSGFLPVSKTPLVGVSSEPSVPMLTSVPAIAIDTPADTFGDTDSIISTVSYSRAYLSAQYSRARKGPADPLSKEFWMKDENATSCFRCSRPFTTFRRRHHCRICGQIFCGSCTSLVAGSHVSSSGNVRCCELCMSSLDTQHSSSDEEDVTGVSFVGSYPDSMTAFHRRDDFRIPNAARFGPVLTGEHLEHSEEDDDTDPNETMTSSFSNRMPSTGLPSVHITRPRSNTNRSQRSIQQLVKFPVHTSSVDLSSAAAHHTEAYLNKLIAEAELPSDPWASVLLQPLYTAAASVHAEFLPNQIDPREWIKVKRICGGTPQDIDCISGTIFTHALAQRVMPSHIQNPRILLITFPIEYSRGTGSYMSLEPILAQEQEYLRKLVTRIEALKPTMLLSTTSIARSALEMLSLAGIAVACYVPENAIQRLARYTQADVLSSFDKLSTNPRLGFCSEFERRIYRYGDMAKTFLFFTGISANSGCTIILRGEENELAQVKPLMEVMAVVVTSLKLETALMRDQFVLLPAIDDGPVLSSSPFVDFGRPYLQKLTQQLEDEVVHAKTTIEIEPEKEEADQDDSELIDWKSRAIDLGIKVPLELPGGWQLLRRYVAQIQNNRHEQAHGRWNKVQEQWDQLETQSPYLFSPTFHQSLVVLFASACRPVSGIICIGPESVMMDYYLNSDLTLGQWIEQFCQTYNDSCPENCGHAMSEHDRYYIHGEGRLSCAVEPHDCPMPGMTDTILMWSYCKKCDQVQPVVPMSSSTWKYSLGKYFELAFWGKPLSLRAGVCPHNIYRDHVRYFGWHNLAVKVEYQAIDLFDVKTPTPIRHVDSVGAINYKIDSFVDIRAQLIRFWESVLYCVNQVKLEGLDEEKLSEGLETLAQFKQRAEYDRDVSVNLLDRTFVTSEPEDTLALNNVYLHVQALVEKWHQDFSTFDGMFFPSEKDIRRVTAQHLRSMFLEDEKLSEDSSGPGLAPAAEITGQAEATSSSEPAESPDEDEVTQPMPIIGMPDLSPQKPTSSVRVQTKFGNKIDFEVGSLENQAPKPQIKPKKEQHVSLLVKHFEELSREFELERTRERQRLKERRDALTLKQAPPVAEILQDLNDAEEDWNDDDVQQRTHVDKSSGREFPESGREEDAQSVVTAGSAPDLDLAPDSESKGLVPLLERNSLIKSLVNFWAERSSTRWSEIEYMLSPTEHLFNDSLVVIREDEPSSIIAFCLSLPDYQSRIRAGISSEPDNVLSAEQRILKQTGVHMRYQFEERQTKISCKIFFSEQFDAIREQCGIESEYLQSLSRCIPWEGSGGKSGSSFMKTRNGRFILKEMSQPEFDAFVSIAPSYFEYTSQALFHELPSVLARIFGFYQIQIRNVNRQYKLYVMVMENLFYGQDSLRLFDLKGSMRNRKAAETGKANEVLLDENMVEYIHEHPLFVREHTKKMLRTSLYNDSLFLTKMNVMDYSLVIGINEQTRTVYAGLVDFVRTYTWDKKIESWVKGRTTTRVKEPTVISPRQYKVRFRESMEQYFLMVPDCWSELAVSQSFQPEEV